MKAKLSLTLLLWFLCQFILAQDANYVKVYTYVGPERFTTKTVYYDDFGRESAIVQEKCSPDGGKDIVRLAEYDAFGRKSRQWLPVSMPQSCGMSQKDAFKKLAGHSMVEMPLHILYISTSHLRLTGLPGNSVQVRIGVNTTRQRDCR